MGKTKVTGKTEGKCNSAKFSASAPVTYLSQAK